MSLTTSCFWGPKMQTVDFAGTVLSILKHLDGRLSDLRSLSAFTNQNLFLGDVSTEFHLSHVTHRAYFYDTLSHEEARIKAELTSLLYIIGCFRDPTATISVHRIDAGIRAYIVGLRECVSAFSVVSVITVPLFMEPYIYLAILFNRRFQERPHRVITPLLILSQVIIAQGCILTTLRSFVHYVSLSKKDRKRADSDMLFFVEELYTSFTHQVLAYAGDEVFKFLPREADISGKTVPIRVFVAYILSAQQKARPCDTSQTHHVAFASKLATTFKPKGGTKAARRAKDNPPPNSKQESVLGGSILSADLSLPMNKKADAGTLLSRGDLDQAHGGTAEALTSKEIGFTILEDSDTDARSATPLLLSSVVESPSIVDFLCNSSLLHTNKLDALNVSNLQSMNSAANSPRVRFLKFSSDVNVLGRSSAVVGSKLARSSLRMKHQNKSLSVLSSASEDMSLTGLLPSQQLFRESGLLAADAPEKVLSSAESSNRVVKLRQTKPSTTSQQPGRPPRPETISLLNQQRKRRLADSMPMKNTKTFVQRKILRLYPEPPDMSSLLCFASLDPPLAINVQESFPVGTGPANLIFTDISIDNTSIQTFDMLFLRFFPPIRKQIARHSAEKSSLQAGRRSKVSQFKGSTSSLRDSTRLLHLVSSQTTTHSIASTLQTRNSPTSSRIGRPFSSANRFPFYMDLIQEPRVAPRLGSDTKQNIEQKDDTLSISLLAAELKWHTERWTGLASSDPSDLQLLCLDQTFETSVRGVMDQMVNETNVYRKRIINWGEECVRMAGQEKVPADWAPMLAEDGIHTRYLNCTTGRIYEKHPEIARLQKIIEAEHQKLDSMIKFRRESNVLYSHEVMKRLTGTGLFSAQINKNMSHFLDAVSSYFGEQIVAATQIINQWAPVYFTSEIHEKHLDFDHLTD